jgi:muramidase (phage lysozyme)
MTQNVKAFLDMLAWSEGTSTSRYTKNEGYDVVVGGVDSPHTFTDYSKHPGVLVTVNSKGLKSTAAGRYQLLQKYAAAYTKSLRLADFGPASQDAIALQQIKEQSALAEVQAGRIVQAIAKCANIWASLPGAGYGQREHSIDSLIAAYLAAGGTLA